MINELNLLWVSNFIALGIYFIFGTKFSWNEGIGACFNVRCVFLKILSRANSLIANNNIRRVMLEIKNDRCKIVKILIFRSLSREHFQSKIHFENFLLWKCSRERERNISILTIFHLSFLISNMTLLILLFAIKCVLFGRNCDFLGGYLVVTAPYLVVAAGYGLLAGGYWWLRLVTGGYCSLPLVTAPSHF